MSLIESAPPRLRLPPIQKNGQKNFSPEAEFDQVKVPNRGPEEQ